MIIYKTNFCKPGPSLHVYTGLGNKTVGIIFMIDYFYCSIFDKRVILVLNNRNLGSKKNKELNTMETKFYVVTGIQKIICHLNHVLKKVLRKISKVCTEIFAIKKFSKSL